MYGEIDDQYQLIVSLFNMPYKPSDKQVSSILVLFSPCSKFRDGRRLGWPRGTAVQETGERKAGSESRQPSEEA
jgi:hypothetical protein